MSFQEELLEVIKKAKQEKEQEERERREFETGWNDRKGSVILPVFREAAAAFARSGMGGEPDLRNGSITLRALYGRGDFQHELTFSPDKEKLEILYTSSLEGDPNETFTLDALSLEVIQDKVRRFAYSVARGKESSKGGVIVLPFGL